MNRIVRIVAVVVAFALAGCASTTGGTRAQPLLSYSGNLLPKSQAALLRSREPPGFGGIEVRLISIDGKVGPNRVGYGNGWDGSFYVSIAPGKHTLSVGFFAIGFAPQLARLYATELQEVTFTAIAGREYVLDVHVDTSTHTWTPTLVDTARPGGKVY